jgi:hypothetical protein
MENLEEILLRIWFYLKKIIFINIIQGFSGFFCFYISKYSAQMYRVIRPHGHLCYRRNPMLITTKQD